MRLSDATPGLGATISLHNSEDESLRAFELRSILSNQVAKFRGRAGHGTGWAWDLNDRRYRD